MLAVYSSVKSCLPVWQITHHYSPGA